MKAGLLDELSFLKLSRKSIIRNFDDLNWKDLPMILSVADKLNLKQYTTRKEYLQFTETINDSIESLMEKSCKDPASVPY